MKLPKVFVLEENEFVAEAKKYVNKFFMNNPGSLDHFSYPINSTDAQKVLDDFLIYRMSNFGAYEDAILKNESILFHSILTPALNIGLLTPTQILQRTLELHEQHNFPLNSLEGFIRQIIGWREFMRLMYDQKGVFLRTNNHFKYSRKIPASFYTGTTGIIPIDQTIKKVLATGYCHHIERLMVLSNFMLLCEFDPEEVYRWFMELFIDAYDWVMVPNVYGMGQYADGGLMTTKPYVSGSSYILKMSDYAKGDWCELWDALYWRFIYIHRESFAKNIRMSMMVSLVNKMDEAKLKKHLRVAEKYLASLE
jgi:deoxyribodipyrimidine photolyase-related protein